jgi:hypothetical protein
MNPGTFQGAGTGVIQQGGFPRQAVISSSMTWTAPYTGRYLVIAIGGGGGGSGSGNVAASHSGGGAGGICFKSVYLGAGAQLTVTIGAGGTGGNYAAGNAGGSTYVYGPNLNLVANGGSGGNRNTGAGSSGGAGGNATGGDNNYSGGRGGNSNSVSGQTGGGAVAFYGIAYNGGNTNASSTATGGGGIGGHGGTCNSTTTVSVGGTAAFGGQVGAENFDANPGASLLGTSGFGNGRTGFNGAFSSAANVPYSVMGGGPGILFTGSGAGEVISRSYMGGGGGSGAIPSGNVTGGTGGDGVVIISWMQS